MVKVLSTKELERIEQRINPRLELTLIKTKNFDLVPVGYFRFKFDRPKKEKFNILVVADTVIDRYAGMPLTPDQKKLVVKLMKKTDVLYNKKDYRHYTISDNDLVQIRHENITMYVRLAEQYKDAIGFQVTDKNCDDISPLMDASFCLYSLTQAIDMLRETNRKYNYIGHSWQLLEIKQGDVEEPTLMFKGNPLS